MSENNKETTKEKNITGASYLIQFYNRVINLNEFAGNYKNILTELYMVFGEELKGFKPEFKDTVITVTQNLRQEINVTHTMLKAINSVIEEKHQIKIDEKLLQELNNKFMMERDSVTQYVDLINGFLVKQIISDLLVNSRNLINQLYE